jgi:stress-induced morphogen
MTAEFKLINLRNAGGYISVDVTSYDDLEDVKYRLEREFSEAFFEIIDEAIFHHKFSEAHRDIFYVVNPELKPKG